MKKLVLVILLGTGMALSSQAQELGVRFGDVTGGNVALDVIFSTSKFSRVHADASFGNGGLGLDLLYDFTFRPIGNDGFYWYAGFGPTLLINDVDNDFLFGLSGELGIEYAFQDAPISLSLDWRPVLAVVENTDFYGERFGFNIRFVF